MGDYIHLRSRLFDTPLMLTQRKLNDILAVVGPRMGLGNFAAVTTGPAGGPLSRMAAPLALYVIPCHGTLVNRGGGVDAMSGMTSYDSLRSLLHAGKNETRAGAIVLDVDSYGGECAGNFDLAREIAEVAKVKPVYAVVNTNCLSAAYSLASACTKIIVTGDSLIGSIGVVAAHVDLSKHNDQEGVAVTYIYAGAHKVDFNEDAPLSEGATKWMRESVDRSYAEFVALVAANRGISEKDIRATEAAIYSSDEAKRLGLVDEIMPASEAFAFIQNEVQNMSNTNQGDGAPAGGAAAAAPATTATTAAPAAAAAAPSADAVAAAAANAVTAANTNAAAIIDMCAAVGKSAMAADFIRRGLTNEQAKSALFDSMASAAAPVDTSLANATSTDSDQSTQLLVAAMKSVMKGD